MGQAIAFSVISGSAGGLAGFTVNHGLNQVMSLVRYLRQQAAAD